jgi:hypothetical protein
MREELMEVGVWGSGVEEEEEDRLGGSPVAGD